jgi:cell division protein FtsW (lipid II flippase)
LQQPTTQQHPFACLHFAGFCCFLKVVCVIFIFPSLSTYFLLLLLSQSCLCYTSIPITIYLLLAFVVFSKLFVLYFYSHHYLPTSCSSYLKKINKPEQQVA